MTSTPSGRIDGERGPDLGERHGPRSGWPCRPRRRPTPPRPGRWAASRCRDGPPAGTRTSGARPRAARPRRRTGRSTAGSPAQVDDAAAGDGQEIAEDRAARGRAAGPGPGQADRPERRRHRSRRGSRRRPSSRTGCRPGTAVGTTAPMTVSPSRVALASSLRVRPRAAAPSISRSRTPVMPGAPVPRTVGGRRTTESGSSHAPNPSRARMTSLLTASSPSTSPRRVRLGIAQLLGVDEDVAVRAALVGHGREDVVGRAVDDAADAHDVVRGEVAGQRAQDRDAAGDRGLEAQRHVGPAGDAPRAPGRGGR